jgi:cysteine synthase A
VRQRATSIERRKLMKFFGAELALTPREKGIGGAIEKAEEIIAETENAVMPWQFGHPANPEIHRRTTAEEIWCDTDGIVDAVVLGVGTGGTLTGVGEVLKARKPDVKIIAVEPENSPVLSGGTHSPQAVLDGIPAGISSGAALACAIRVAQRNEMKGRTIVTVLPDCAERYISTALFEGISED